MRVLDPPGEPRSPSLVNLLGITGGIAAGKTMAADCCRRRGLPVIDADRLGRKVVEQVPELREQLAETFGAEIFDPSGRLRREALGGLVFKEPAALERLNSLIFPYLYKAMVRKIGEFSTEELVVVDAALIFEWGIRRDFQEMWTVRADDELRLCRLRRRNSLSRTEALNRLHSQLPQETKESLADLVIDNSGERAEFLRKVEAELDRLLAELAPD